MPVPSVDEALLCQIWQGQHLNAAALRTGDGQPVQVVYRGRPSSDFGPDFRDGIFATGEGRLIRGDVEIHVRSSDWHAHGHDRDPRYNGVVLHVVLWADALDTHLQSGSRALLLPLADCLPEPLADLRRRLRPAQPRLPCRELADRLGDWIGSRLDRLGDDRFTRKAAVFEGALACRQPSQVLYEGLMEALGYSHNRAPFVAVARQLQLATLEGFLWGRAPDRRARMAEALFLGTAGLLPSQRTFLPPLAAEDRARAAELERIWGEYGGGPAAVEDDWRFGGVRPENYPPRRLAGAAGLVARSLALGLLDQTIGLSKGPAKETPRALESLFAVPADDYWAHHYDFAVAARRGGAMVGGERARTMGLDVVLPFALALAAAEDDPEGQEMAWGSYHAYPRLAENQITRRSVARLFAGQRSDLVNCARRQQGLLHLDRVYCEEGRCGECPLGS